MTATISEVAAAYGMLTSTQADFLTARQHLIPVMVRARQMIAEVFPGSQVSLELFDDGTGPDHLCILVHTDLSYMASIPQGTKLQDRWRAEFARSVNRELTVMLWFEEKKQHGIAPEQRTSDD